MQRQSRLRWPQSANPEDTAMKPRYAGKYRLDDQDMQDDYDQAERNEYGELSERIFFFCSRRSLPNILSKWPCSNQILLELSAFQEIKQLIGAAFTLMCLLTGSLWGRPMWGTYWVWDARLTGRMQIAWPSATTRCTQSSLSVRKRGRITTSRRAKCSRPTHDVSSRKPTRERVRTDRLALITSQRQVSQQLTDGVISIGAFPLSFVCSQPRPSR